MRVYHFRKDIEKSHIKVHNLIKINDTIVCFDFEDSIASDKPEGLVKVRNEHRDDILAEFELLKSKNKYSDFGFRINKISSSNYIEDIKALSKFKEINCIFVPKVESAEEFKKVLSDLSFPIQEIIPIIETQRGFDKAEDIISVSDSRFKSIAFGHCDYNLSQRNFPFFHQESSEYWSWIFSLNEICLRYDKGIINSPVLELENEHLIRLSKYNCKKYSQVKGHISLCKNHTEVLSEKSSDLDQHDLIFKDGSENRKRSAEDIISFCDRFKVKNKSFGLTLDRVIISPQEREMALLIKRGI